MGRWCCAGTGRPNSARARRNEWLRPCSQASDKRWATGRAERRVVPLSLSALTVRDRIQLSILDVLSMRGLYLGRRSTKIHVALYRRTKNRAEAGLPLVEHMLYFFPRDDRRQ